MKKLILPLIIAALIFAPTAQAVGLLSPGGQGPLQPGLWVPNSGSSTITPNPNNLQVPCANIVGGCSSGVSTSTANTFSLPQTFNGIVNNGTSSFVGDISLASGTVVYTSPNGYKLVGDLGTYYNNLCTAGLAVASSVTFIPSPQIVASTSWTVQIAFTGKNNRCQIHAPGNGSVVWNWGGSTSTYAIKVDSSDATDNFSSGPQGVAISGLTLFGCAGPTGCTTSTSTAGGAIQLGGSNGAAHQAVEWNWIDGFSNCVDVGQNTYNVYIDHNTLENCGHNVHVETANNSTEGVEISQNWITEPGNHVADDCVLLETNGGDNVVLEGNVIDDCAVHWKGGVTVQITSNKTEHPNPLYPNYIPFVGDSSQFSSAIITGEKVYFTGGASSSYPELFNIGSSFQVYGLAIGMGNTTSTPLAFVIKDDAGTTFANWTICGVTTDQSNNRQPYTQFSPNGPTSVIPTSTFNGCAQQVGNGSTTLTGALGSGYQIAGGSLYVPGGDISLGSTTDGGQPFQVYGAQTGSTTPALRIGIGGSVGSSSWISFNGDRAGIGYDGANNTFDLYSNSAKPIRAYVNESTPNIGNGTLAFSLTGSGGTTGTALFGTGIHMGFTTSAMTVSSGTISGSENGGLITVTTSTATFTLTFPTKFLNNPVCVSGISSGTALALACQAGLANATITAGSAVPTSSIISYIIQGNPN